MSMLIVSFHPPLASGGALLTTPFLNLSWYLVGTESKCATFVWIHQLPRYTSISSLVALCGLHLQACPSL